jgi:hypothetical protein
LRIRSESAGVLSAALALLMWTAAAWAQAVPYARSYSQSKAEVERALKDLQAYSGQKLPILDGFVAPVSHPLDQYERGFYQYSIEMLPGDAGATVVRLTAKITAWHVDRDVSKSGYEVLPSNGRLELDLLDRLQEKLTGKPVDPPATLNTNVQAPRPKLDLSGVPGAAALPAAASPVAKTPDEVAALRNERVVAERRVQQLTAERDNLKDIQKNQARPQNLVIVTKPGGTIYDKPSDNARPLFQAALNDEFEYLDGSNGWIHISISGDSRGYVRQSSVQLPERIASQLAIGESGLEQKFPGFRIEQESTSSFPGNWPVLKGKQVKIFTVQPIGQNAKDSGPTARLNYAMALFEKTLQDSPSTDGVVVIYDAADGGIVAAATADIQKHASGALTREAFWAQAYLDPPDAFGFPAKQ